MFSGGSVLKFTCWEAPCWFWFTAEAQNASAAPAKSPDVAEDEPNGGVIERTHPTSVDLKVEEKTDDEGVDSNKTSVESLRETNENNSNNTGPLWQSKQAFYSIRTKKDETGFHLTKN